MGRASNPGSKRIWACGIPGCLLLLVAAIIIGAVCLTQSDRTTPPASGLTASVGMDDDSLRVQNGDSFDWMGATITINNLYSQRVDTIRAGQTVDLSRDRFVAGDGTRFASEPLEVLQVSIRTDSPAGGYWEGAATVQTP